MGWGRVGWGMGDAGGGGSGRSCRCVFPIPDYRPPPPPDFLHQITSTSWSHPFLLSSIALHCNRNGGKTVGYKADTFNWPNCPAAKRLMADSHDPIGSNGSRQDSIHRSKNTLRFLAISSLATDLPFVAPRNIFMCSNCMFCTQKEC